MNSFVSKRAKGVKMSPLQSFFIKAKGMFDVIQLGVGDPEGETSDVIKDFTCAALRANHTHYIPAGGSLRLREGIRDWYDLRDIYGVTVEEIAVTSGSRIILSALLWSLLDLGDKVMITAPYYPSFVDLTKDYGGEPVIVDTRDDNFILTAKRVEEVIKEHGVPKVLILNSPNNPTGVSYPEAELRKIVDLSEEHGFLIISDECYQYFSDNPDFSMRKFSDKVVVVDSVSKQYFMTGWRVGWCIGPTEIVNAVKQYLGLHVSSPCSVSEQAAIRALFEKPSVDDFSKQRQIMSDWFKKHNLSMELSGGFYAFVDFSGFLDSQIQDSVDLADYILTEAKVALAPGISFGDYDTYLRIAYCVKVDTLKEALNRLDKCLESLKNK